MNDLPVLVVRPEPGNATTQFAASSAGLLAIGSPLFEMAPLDWTVPNPASYDAMLIGSANAIRHGGSGLETLRSLPVYAVGESTAAAATAAGFAVAATGAGGLSELLHGALADGRESLLRLAGEKHVALEAPDGRSIETVLVYTARPLPLSPAAHSALQAGALVLLHSAEAARRFAGLVDAAAIDRARILLCCLGPRIAAAAGTGWAACRAAPVPLDAALLALAAEMCQASTQGFAGKTG